MRRGSVTTYVDDGRRHSAGMVTPEFRSNNRQEFTVNDIDYERTGGCFVSYRKIAFAFVIFLAIVIAAAFIGVYIGSPPEDNPRDSLNLLTTNTEAPIKYVFSPFINPIRYRIELLPIPNFKTGKTKILGHVNIHFQQTMITSATQLVLYSKNLTYKSYRLISLDKNKNVTALPASSSRHKRDVGEAQNETTTTVTETIPTSISTTLATTTTGTTTTATTTATTTTATTLSAPPENEKVTLMVPPNPTPSVNSSVKSFENTSDSKPMQKSLEVPMEPTVKSEIKITSNKGDDDAGIHIFFLENPLQLGNYSLELQYEGTVDKQVMIARNGQKNNHSVSLLVSKLKPVGASRIFPTFDDAKLKASFALTVLHPTELKALSNMPVISSSVTDRKVRKKIFDITENVTADIFAETSVMSAHNLAFVTGNFESLGEVTIEETPLVKKHMISYWGNLDHKTQEFYLRDKIAPIAYVYADFFEGIERPTSNLNIVALPLGYDGFSSPGLIVIRESHFYSSVGSPGFMKARALVSLTGLFGQQWLGGLTDGKNWTDSWFIEGSVLYLKYALVDKIDPNLEVSNNFLIEIQLESMENDGYFISKALDTKVERVYIENFDLVDPYNKGACLISMLHSILNKKGFKSDYAGFLRLWKHTSADSDTFLSIIVGNSTIDDKSTDEWTEFFNGWTRQAGYPLVNVTFNPVNNTVLVQQAKFNFDELWNKEKKGESIKDLWWVPLTYVTSEGNWSAPDLVWLKGKQEKTFKIPGPVSNSTWIVCNVNMTGYYRVLYDQANWRSIIKVLRTKHDDFPVPMRTALIDDALSLAHQGSLSFESAFDLITYMGPNERDFGPWAALAKHARQLDFALFETKAYPYYQEYMRNLVSSLFDDMEQKIDEGSALAMLAIRLACTYEYKKCRSWGRNKWNDLFNNNENVLLKHVRQTVYCSGARAGGPEDLAYLMKKIDEAHQDEEERNKLLQAFACFQNPWILKKILIETLDTQKYKSKDINLIVQSYLKNPTAAQVAGRFTLEYWNEIVKRFSKSYWTMKAFIEASTKFLITEMDLEEFNTFRDKHIESMKMLGHWVALNEMKAISWIFRLKDSSERIQTWFQNHLNSTQ